jgi:predicted dehydrogenase
MRTKEPIRFGVIGVGLWREVHAEIYSNHPCAALAAVCDHDSKRAKQVAQAHGAERVYTDFRDLAADPGIDAVAVVTPDFAHRDPIVAAAEAGKHIITEKPLATTLEDAEAIAKAVRKAGITFMVDFHARWNPPLAIARQNITEGKLGRIISAYFRLNDTISVPTEILSWAEKSSTSVNDIKVNILGSKGMINMDLTNNQMIERYLEDSTDHPDCLVKPQVRDRFSLVLHHLSTKTLRV